MGGQRRGRVSGERRSRVTGRPARGREACRRWGGGGLYLERFIWRREHAARCELKPGLLVGTHKGTTFLESKLA